MPAQMSRSLYLPLVACLLAAPTVAVSAGELTGVSTAKDWTEATTAERMAWLQFVAAAADLGSRERNALHAVSVGACIDEALRVRKSGERPVVAELQRMKLAELSALCSVLSR